MALTVTLAALRASIRRQLDAEGKSARERHPEASIDEAAALGIAALQRLFRIKGGGDRFLATATITLPSTTLPADFESLVLVELTYNGTKRYLLDYDHAEHPCLTSPNVITTGEPVAYKIYGSTIECVPSAASGTLTIWYVPQVVQVGGTIAEPTFDTIARFDEYPVLYAVRWLGIKDKAWDLVDRIAPILAQLEGDVEWYMKHRDQNSQRVIRDVYANTSSRGPRWRERF